MSRNRNQIIRYVSFEMQELAMKLNGMTDEQIGAWFRKAVVDLCSGCLDPNTDPFIKDVYNKSHSLMVKRQEHNARMYQNRIANSKANNSAETASNSEKEASNAMTPTDIKSAYGQNQHVMLTIDEGKKLREAYGPDLDLAINILDGYIENNGKAAKKYKNHYAVLRRGNWVWNKVKETKLQEQRLENASHSNKSFKQQDMDARTKFFSTSVVPEMEAANG